MTALALAPSPIFEQALDALDAKFDQYADVGSANSSYLTFITDHLGIDLWEKQIEIVESVQHHRRTAVKSCHGGGKTLASAAIIVAHIHIYPGSKAIFTGPSKEHVGQQLWQEVRGIYSRSLKPLLGRPLLTPRWEIAANWFALGIKPADANPERIQGYHSPDILLVVDEANIVAPQIINAMDALLTSANARILELGNPVVPAGPFFDAFNAHATMWHGITIKAADTPNIRTGRTVVPGLVDQQWIDDAIEKHGADSPYVRSRVDGEFPDDDGSTFIGREVVDRARLRDPVDLDTDPYEAAYDVARFGGDENFLVMRHGERVVNPGHGWLGMDTMASVGYVRRHIHEWLDADAGPDAVCSVLKIDMGSFGASVYDRMAELIASGEETRIRSVVGVNFGGKSSDSEKFGMIRDEMWWNLRQRFRDNRVSGPVDAVAAEQMHRIGYTYQSSHTHPKIESKESYKKRWGGSPDRADAYIMCFYIVPPKKGPTRAKPTGTAGKQRFGATNGTAPSGAATPRSGWAMLRDDDGG